MALSATAARIGQALLDGGVVDFLLPFLLVFTIVFAILQKANIFHETKKEGTKNVPGAPNRNVNVAISLILGLMFVIPHITRTYPAGYDPVQIINEALPGIALVAIACFMTLLIVGLFGKKVTDSSVGFLVLAAFGFIIYIFGAALGAWGAPSSTFSWWTTQTTELVIILLVFGIIVWFITRDPSKTEVDPADPNKRRKKKNPLVELLKGLTEDQ